MVYQILTELGDLFALYFPNNPMCLLLPNLKYDGLKHQIIYFSSFHTLKIAVETGLKENFTFTHNEFSINSIMLSQSIAKCNLVILSPGGEEWLESIIHIAECYCAQIQIRPVFFLHIHIISKNKIDKKVLQLMV